MHVSVPYSKNPRASVAVPVLIIVPTRPIFTSVQNMTEMAHILTRLAHAECEIDPATAALIPPIHLATTYERQPDGTYPLGFKYARDGSPTRAQLEKSLAAIEGGFASWAFPSGMAVCNAVLQALPRDAYIIIPDDVYHGFRRLVREQFESRGMRVSAVDMTDLESVQRVMHADTAMIWAESPSNPLLKISDIQSLSALAKQHDALFIVDGTWTTPLLQKPLELGADAVVHSLTKYMAGHSDVLGGAIIAGKESDYFHRIAHYQQQSGAVLDPFSSWLTIRGIRSLGVRLSHQCASAKLVAAFLSSHGGVREVFYPGLASHPGHELAASQMTDFGAMLSFIVDGDHRDAIQVAAKTRVFTRATSLGGTSSLIEHRASMEGPDTLTPPALLRLSIGLEHADDLIGDLENALTKS